MKKINVTKTYISLYKRENEKLILFNEYSRIGRFSKVKEEKMLKENYGKDIIVDFRSEKIEFDIEDILEKIQETEM